MTPDTKGTPVAAAPARYVAADGLPRRHLAEALDLGLAVAVVEALPALVRERMAYEHLSVREVGRQAGVSFSTVSRLLDDQPRDPTLRCALLLLRWLNGRPA